MRRFTDAAGTEWTAVLGRASYGEISLLFTRDGSIEVFCTPLGADTAAGGRDWLAALDDADLQTRLADARPWSGQT